LGEPNAACVLPSGHVLIVEQNAGDVMVLRDGRQWSMARIARPRRFRRISRPLSTSKRIGAQLEPDNERAR
jgi:hypothetical protein